MNSSYECKIKNNDQCGGSAMFSRLFSLQDFSHSENNPFYQAYTNNVIYSQSYHMIFFTICYAYSIFRIFIDITKIIYSYKKIDIIFHDSTNMEILKEKHENKKSPRVHEINFYKYIIYINVWVELLLSIQNFLAWRGLQYFTSYQSDFKNTNRKCNCLFNIELIDFTTKGDKLNYYSGMVFIWLTLDSIRMFVSYFSVLTLSRINRKEKSGKEFLKPNLIKSGILSLVYWILLFLLIMIFDIPIFYRFFNIQVLCFWFFWKSLGFFLLFDRLHSKFWLFQNLKFQTLHSHGIEWKKKLGKVKDNILYSHGEKNGLIKQMKEILKNEKDIKKVDENLYTKIDNLLESQGDEIQNIYFSRIEDFYKKHIEIEIIDKYEDEKKSKLKTKWADYLNFILGLNLLGIIGYLFLLLDNSVMLEQSNDNHYPNITYFIGIFFCYLELIIDDLSHGIFLLHCFFIELFGFLKENKNIKSQHSECELEELDRRLFEEYQSSVIREQN